MNKEYVPPRKNDGTENPKGFEGGNEKPGGGAQVAGKPGPDGRNASAIDDLDTDIAKGRNTPGSGHVPLDDDKRR